MKIEKKKEIVEIQEEVRIPQGNQEIILEKGDKIRVLSEASAPGYYAFDKAKRRAVYYTRNQFRSSEYSDELKDYTIISADDFKWKGPNSAKVLVRVNSPSEKSEISMFLKHNSVVISTAK